MTSWNWINKVPGNGLLPHGTKPLPDQCLLIVTHTIGNTRCNESPFKMHNCSFKKTHLRISVKCGPFIKLTQKTCHCKSGCRRRFLLLCASQEYTESELRKGEMLPDMPLFLIWNNNNGHYYVMCLYPIMIAQWVCKIKKVNVKANPNRKPSHRKVSGLIKYPFHNVKFSV